MLHPPNHQHLNLQMSFRVKCSLLYLFCNCPCVLIYLSCPVHPIHENILRILVKYVFVLYKPVPGHRILQRGYPATAIQGTGTQTVSLHYRISRLYQASAVPVNCSSVKMPLSFFINFSIPSAATLMASARSRSDLICFETDS